MQSTNYNSKWDIRDTIFVILIAILVISTFFRGCKQEDIENKPMYSYKTDTIYVKDTYQKKYEALLNRMDKLGSQVTPPKTITYYQTLNPAGTVIEKIPDSLLVLIDSLNQRIAISDKYIKNFPKNDKLINMGLLQDSFNITTIDIEGKTKTQEYPLYLDKFGYQWYDNKLHHYSIKPKKEFKNVFNQFYINGGYDFLYKTPTLGAEYFILLNKFKVGANANITLQRETQTNVWVSLGYRIF